MTLVNKSCAFSFVKIDKVLVVLERASIVVKFDNFLHHSESKYRQINTGMVLTENTYVVLNIMQCSVNSWDADWQNQKRACPCTLNIFPFNRHEFVSIILRYY